MELVAHFDFELHQMDVKMTFLNGDLEEEVYMKQHEGFPSKDGEHLVCQWEQNLFVLYVDDVLLATNDKEFLYEVKQFLLSNFDMKDMGEAFYVIGIKIHRDRSRGNLRLFQEAYIKKVLERFGMKDCSPSVAPIMKGDRFSLDQCPRNDIERNSNQGIDHWKAAKKVLRYLQDTKDYMLMYRWTDSLEVVGYSDSDFRGCNDSSKSTSGYVFMLANRSISWRSTKQTLTTLQQWRLNSFLILRQPHMVHD
ncbi:hypothetical protein LIER_04872 [Lithospermum erythrorhizon]|uniref:Reverse transcriptase Ty1/copia-type domain-containing protein n=1 Tax=Lithospermum erythrorhizon TaxID=34254 RepID=A0AAV3NZX4_LITER